MRKYNRPELECINFRIEERLASTCTGSCTVSTVGYKLVDGKWQEVRLEALSGSV